MNEPTTETSAQHSAQPFGYLFTYRVLDSNNEPYMCTIAARTETEAWHRVVCAYRSPVLLQAMAHSQAYLVRCGFHL